MREGRSGGVWGNHGSSWAENGLYPHVSEPANENVRNTAVLLVAVIV